MRVCPLCGAELNWDYQRVWSDLFDDEVEVEFQKCPNPDCYYRNITEH